MTEFGQSPLRIGMAARNVNAVSLLWTCRFFMIRTNHNLLSVIEIDTWACGTGGATWNALQGAQD